MLPQLLHILPVADDTVLDGVVHVVNDGGENFAGSFLISHTGLHHAGSAVKDND